MFNSVCGEQQPHPARHEAGTERPGPQTSGGPQGTGPPGEPPQGQPRPPPRKGQRRARRWDLRQPQCRRPRVPWRQARRFHRQPTTPGQTGPWARRPQQQRKPTAQTPTGRPAHPLSPRPQTENREQGCEKKKKKKKDPMLHLTRSNVVLVCVVLRCFKTGVL